MGSPPPYPVSLPLLPITRWHGITTGNRVGAIGKTDGSARFGISDSDSELAVGDSRAIRDFAEIAPNFQLERSALGRELQIEFFQLSSEISLQLADSFPERAHCLLSTMIPAVPRVFR